MISIFLLNTFLLSIRLLPVLVVSSILFFSRIPLTIRLILSLALASVLASALPSIQAPSLSLPVLLGELCLGVVMAFGFHAAHAGVDMAGRLIDTQVGLNASGVFDPTTSNVTSIMADFLGLAFALLFVVLDMHHELLRVMGGMLTVIPPGSVPSVSLSGSLAAVLTQQFLMAFMMLMPVIMGLWLTDMAFAILSRSMPQANIYFLALPIKLGIGVLLILLTLPLLVQRMPLLFESALSSAATPAGGL
ncbi:MAG: flagellar biosynthetic protein FliR [Pseudomonadota bacterium]